MFIATKQPYFLYAWEIWIERIENYRYIIVRESWVVNGTGHTWKDDEKTVRREEGPSPGRS